uniref:Uncharacterized protein n=1 Tax=Palpitomonas bilix TaxID=652834 RepID=A0A7S3D4F3_9EUKA|mmetsp:Transcript_21612/g.56129  ORF Transcript_21612/g.56129 Transcript_21612/m.56129 type:complete len:278 (+) Transcript_21612:121-954(+)|eukprot:CAMPEP_0113870620 /NCGR_PEP_ID=MMETSP0780_2-20120614/2190_1 /TAXON_ID=652834 /ORGANISM="Palpitomonas bilix" /LENGTH=277 /DNA_ID=CAMNT_0000855923 /DNA_START=25 /DNA_END=858 /DNA_ORIENTATION=+ /assembly_acc=CAM_ASM_000599
MKAGFEGVHVVVTGASGGIGIELVKNYLEEGAKVTAQYNTQKGELAQLEEVHDDQLFAVKCDVRAEEEVTALFDSAVERHGPVFSLIANHGIWPTDDTPIVDMGLDRWKNTLDVNLTGVFLCCRQFLRHVRTAEREGKCPKGVNIVLIGSTAGIFGEANHADYSCTKSALMYGMMRSLKNEIARIVPTGRVNSVAPGWVATPLSAAALEDEKLIEKTFMTLPLRKVAYPPDIANACLYLSSPVLAGHVSGEIIEVTGGMEGRVLYTREEALATTAKK